MTRTQRLNLKKKYKRLQWLSLGMIAFFVLNMVLLFTIDWRPHILTDESGITDINAMIWLGVILMYLFAPLGLGLSFNVRATWVLQELSNVRKAMYVEKNKMYVRRVFNHVMCGEFKEAINVHDNFVRGDAKAVTRGVLIGALYFKGKDEDQDRALKNMVGIVEEEM